MTEMFLVVKGKMSDAINEALRRRIEIRIDGVSINEHEVYCYSPLVYKPNIIEWYAKGLGVASIAAPGDLLWYAERVRPGE